MILLHVTDLHFHLPWFHWLREQAPPHDVLILSGDLLDQRRSDFAGQVDRVSGWLRSSPVPVVVSSGTHDLRWDADHRGWMPAYWLRQLPAPVHADGAVLERDGLSITGIARTQWPRSAKADGWVVHAPPAGTATARTRTGVDRGDRSLAAAMRRQAPAWVFCGQVHDPQKWHHTEGGTTVLNPGANPHGRFPNHILLNTRTGEVRRIVDQLHGGFSERTLTPRGIDAEVEAGLTV